MAPPNLDSQVRQRIVGDEEVNPKALFERNYVPMDLTIKEIREAIPAHLFIRNTTKSIMYAVKDVVTIASLLYCATFIDTLPSLTLRISAWVAYSIVQGTVMVGPFVLGHGKHIELTQIQSSKTRMDWTRDKNQRPKYASREMSLYSTATLREKKGDIRLHVIWRLCTTKVAFIQCPLSNTPPLSLFSSSLFKNVAMGHSRTTGPSTPSLAGSCTRPSSSPTTPSK